MTQVVCNKAGFEGRSVEFQVVGMLCGSLGVVGLRWVADGIEQEVKWSQ